ncbi:MAG: site-2 protease family protein [Phaeodactylibacter sp.]|uniref:site-2 protease family protein n=1 Tax=Phaeodactylibacter sp. TaxID=1940289 RepID=UPI0032EDE9AD
MSWSLKILRLFGINVYIHWTFLILLGWIFLSSLGAGQNIQQALLSIAFILTLFACVVLHEYGHALTARRFGVSTRRITLLPIGGVASLEKMPEKPREELLVAIAGPAVNLVIAALLFSVMQIADIHFPTEQLEDPSQISLSNAFIPNLLAVNIILVLFNLIPAFPMDGGRVLRALLAMKYDRAKATAIAAQIGQFLAIGFVFLGFMYDFWLIFIGLFIFLGASGESRYEATRHLLTDLKVADVLMHQFTKMDAWSPISEAVDTLLDGQEKDFIVTEQGDLIGTISRDDILRGLQEVGPGERIKRIVNTNWSKLSPELELNKAYELMNQQNLSICPVYSNEGELLGVLNTENILEAIMIERARGGQG